MKRYKILYEYNNHKNELYLTGNSLKEAKKKAENYCKNSGTKLTHVELDKTFIKRKW